MTEHHNRRLSYKGLIYLNLSHKYTIVLSNQSLLKGAVWYFFSASDCKCNIQSLSILFGHALLPLPAHTQSAQCQPC